MVRPLFFLETLSPKRLTDLGTFSFPTIEQAIALCDSLKGIEKLSYTVQVAEYGGGSFGVVVSNSKNPGDIPVPLLDFIAGFLAQMLGDSSDVESYSNAYNNADTAGQERFTILGGKIITQAEPKYSLTVVLDTAEGDIAKAAEYLTEQLTGKWFKEHKFIGFAAVDSKLVMTVGKDDQHLDLDVFDLVHMTLEEFWF